MYDRQSIYLSYYIALCTFPVYIYGAHFSLQREMLANSLGSVEEKCYEYVAT